jgi:hypothetical protein
MHGLGVYTWKIGDKYIGEVRAALRSLSGPAEDSCLSLARSCHFHVPCPCPCPCPCSMFHVPCPCPCPCSMWPTACGCLAQVQRTYARQHGMCRPRSAACGVARVERRPVRVTLASTLCEWHGPARAPAVPRAPAGAVWADPRLRHVHLAHGQQVRGAVEGGQDARAWHQDRPGRCSSTAHLRCGRGGALGLGLGVGVGCMGGGGGSSRRPAAPTGPPPRCPAGPPHRHRRIAAPPAGNIFEGDWKEGKPQLKDNKSKDWANLLPWLNETVPAPSRRN